ncbi:MAG: excinuclease ABC subunit UvrA [Planctomycetia bacterium]|nr:excinuclease ABC subunit UvrA [Planctomycetia bacterium]
MSDNGKKASAIELRNVRVHNLKSIDLDLPYNKLVVFCGLSGSGKSSLAIDTLYAEGQRRYIESFSASTRQFLEKVEKPDAERIDGIPPSIAITSRPLMQLSRSTIGTTTETSDYLRLLFSKIGQVYCQLCGREVRRDTPDSILKSLEKLEDGSRVLIAFSPPAESLRAGKSDFEAEWQEAGFFRGFVLGDSFRLDEPGGIPLNKYLEARLLYLADQVDEGEDFSRTVTTGDNQDSESDSVSEEATGDLDPFDHDFDPFDDSFSNRGHSSGEGPVLDAEGEESEVLSSGEHRHEDPADDKSSSRLLTINPNNDTYFENYQQRQHEMHKPGGPPPLFFTVDRVTIGTTASERIRDSLETALFYGNARCWIACEGTWKLKETESLSQIEIPVSELGQTRPGAPIGTCYTIDDRDWTLVGFSRHLRCEDCGLEYPPLEPKLFNFNSPLGACSLCEGFGNLMVLDLDLIVPNKNKSLADGAIAPWNGSSYRHKLNELLELAPKANLRTDIPFAKLSPHELDFVLNGSKESGYDGLNGFFIRLQKQKYKMHIRVFLSRWRSYRVCPLCHGTRLRPESLAVRVGNHNIHDLTSMQISEFLNVLRSWQLSPWQQEIGQTALKQLTSRLGYLEQVGLGYLTLDRLVRTLSEGEQRRVNLTSVLGSSLVDVLYVLDEPSIGLHPYDTQHLLEAIKKLRDRGNSVVVVEHEEAILKAADRIVEIGPGAGQGGGEIVFNGTCEELRTAEKSVTGKYLFGNRLNDEPPKRRILEHGFLELTGVSGYNLKNINVVFPLGVLCVVTGVSGAGKSTLVQETLYPAVCRKLGKDSAGPGLPYDQILGTGQIDDVVLVDQSPIGRSPRSNPVTYLKIFDDIRALFAETPDAKARNFNAGYFSFNVDGGRCNTCKGEGFIVIDMQFMADMFVRCPQCNGRRYQQEILDIFYRGKNIAEVLDMTVREAFAFFRGQAKIQQRLKRLIDVGLDYLRLGQPANTLSGGESQRLKLAAYLSNSRKGRCLFILDEPTTGLHFADIVQLIDGFDALVETGHSLIVVEHNLQMIRAADYVIDLGPGAADQGGTIVAEGTPEQIARVPESKTGQFLRDNLEHNA